MGHEALSFTAHCIGDHSYLAPVIARIGLRCDEVFDDIPQYLWRQVI